MIFSRLCNIMGSINKDRAQDLALLNVKDLENMGINHYDLYCQQYFLWTFKQTMDFEQNFNESIVDNIKNSFMRV